MSSTVDNSGKTGNILMLGSLAVSLVLPLALIMLSYLGIISGTAQYIVAIAVILSSVYIIGGSIWMFFQDIEDGKTLTDG
jgi:uncharacterized membrane protein YqjE